MKKVVMFLCIVIMFFGIVGCPDSSDNPGTTPSFTSTPVAPSESSPEASPVPEPATLFLLGSGLVGLAVLGRKKFKK